MVAVNELSAVFSQPALTAEHLEALQNTAFSSVESLVQFRDMTESLEREVMIRDGDRDGALKVGLCQWVLGRPARALEWFSQARNTKERHFYAGLCHREMGHFDKALNEFERAAASGWDELECACERAETLLAAGEAESAAKLLDSMASRGRSSASWHYVQGRAIAQRGEVDAGISEMEQAIQLNAHHNRALFHMAFLSDLHGLDEQAIELYRRCVQTPPVHVNALINLAVLYEDHGRTSEAEECLRRVLATYPNHLRAQLFLKDVMASAEQVIDEQWERQAEQWQAILDTPISEYELSVRSRNCLKKLNINTLGDLTRVTQVDLLAYKNFGETSLNEIKAMLTQKGLRIGQSLEQSPAPAATTAAAAPAKPATRKPVAGNPELLNRPVSELELSVRSRKCLQRLGVSSVGDLASRSEQELLAVRNFGQTSLAEIKRRLADIGISLRSPNT